MRRVSKTILYQVCGLIPRGSRAHSQLGYSGATIQEAKDIIHHYAILEIRRNL